MCFQPLFIFIFSIAFAFPIERFRYRSPDPVHVLMTDYSTDPEVFLTVDLNVSCHLYITYNMHDLAAARKASFHTRLKTGLGLAGLTSAYGIYANSRPDPDEKRWFGLYDQED